MDSHQRMLQEWAARCGQFWCAHAGVVWEGVPDKDLCRKPVELEQSEGGGREGCHEHDREQVVRHHVLQPDKRQTKSKHQTGRHRREQSELNALHAAGLTERSEEKGAAHTAQSPVQSSRPSRSITSITFMVRMPQAITNDCPASSPFTPEPATRPIRSCSSEANCQAMLPAPKRSCGPGIDPELVSSWRQDC